MKPNSLSAVFFACALAGCAGPQTLFDGQSLAGWRPVVDEKVTGGYTAAEPTWDVKDGAIVTTGTPFGYLRTERDDYADFVLRLEYRWWRPTAKPNSGVFVRLTSESGRFLPCCYENQLCAGSAGDILGLAGAAFAGATPDRPYNASDQTSGISRRTKAHPSSEKPAGEWNILEVEVKGDRLVNRVNGVEQNVVTGLVNRTGAIALQAEGGACAFRNITLCKLP